MAAHGDRAVYVRFDGLTPAEANRSAGELRDLIRDATGGQVRVEIVKERTETQDFGTALTLVLETQSAVLVAQAIYNYIAKRGDRVVIETAEGKVIATGNAAANIDVAKTVSALRATVDA